MAPQHLRIGSYNLHNLFLDAGHDALQQPLKSPRALRALARSIQRMDCDVIAVQEVGSAQALQTLNASLKTPFAHVRLCTSNSSRGIHLGFLSRLPITEQATPSSLLCGPGGVPLLESVDAQDPRLQPLYARRGPALVRVDCRQGRDLLLLNLHLKSQGNASHNRCSAQSVRWAEAHQAAALAKDLRAANAQTGGLLVLAGDLNDRWHSDALTPIRELELADPLGDRLRSEGGNPSTYWPKRGCRFDYLLVDEQPGTEIVDAQLLAFAEARRASDHYPITLELAWR